MSSRVSMYATVNEMREQAYEGSRMELRPCINPFTD